MNITLRIKRYNPQTDNTSHFQNFEVNANPDDRLLVALMFIKRNIDSTLCFRKSCAHGICGSDGMTINNTERLACKTLVKDVAEQNNALVTIEPLKSLPVQRDLMVDYTRFFDTYRLVKPFLIPVQKTEQAEIIQTPAQRKRFDDATNCILCACCYSSCPVLQEKDPAFIGPAAVLQAARFVLDSRDQGIGPRLDVLDNPHGAWPCENHFKCTKVCPRGIKVTKNINMIKHEIKSFKDSSRILQNREIP